VAVDYSKSLEMDRDIAQPVFTEIERENTDIIHFMLRFLREDGRKPTPYKWEELEDMYTRNRGPSPVVGAALLAASKVKHPAFVDEHEYRIITRGVESIYTPSRLGLIPRVLHAFDPLAIKEIMVGPGEFERVRQLSLERCCDSNESYRHVQITTSQVPFRNL
jgi:hypothetical protein